MSRVYDATDQYLGRLYGRFRTLSDALSSFEDPEKQAQNQALGVDVARAREEITRHYGTKEDETRRFHQEEENVRNYVKGLDRTKDPIEFGKFYKTPESDVLAGPLSSALSSFPADGQYAPDEGAVQREIKRRVGLVTRGEESDSALKAAEKGKREFPGQSPSTQQYLDQFYKKFEGDPTGAYRSFTNPDNQKHNAGQGVQIGLARNEIARHYGFDTFEAIGQNAEAQTANHISVESGQSAPQRVSNRGDSFLKQPPIDGTVPSHNRLGVLAEILPKTSDPDDERDARQPDGTVAAHDRERVPGSPRGALARVLAQAPVSVTGSRTREQALPLSVFDDPRLQEPTPEDLREQRAVAAEARANARTSDIERLTRMILASGGGVTGGIANAIGSTAKEVANLLELPNIVGGAITGTRLPPNPLSEALGKFQQGVQERTEEAIPRPTITQDLLASGGRLVIDIPKLVGLTKLTGVPAAAMAIEGALSSADQGLGTALKEGAKGAVAGTLLGSTAKLPLAIAAPVQGLIGAGQAAIEGGDDRQLLTSALLQAGMEAGLGGRGRGLLKTPEIGAVIKPKFGPPQIKGKEVPVTDIRNGQIIVSTEKGEYAVDPRARFDVVDEGPAVQPTQPVPTMTSEGISPAEQPTTVNKPRLTAKQFLELQRQQESKNVPEPSQPAEPAPPVETTPAEPPGPQAVETPAIPEKIAALRQQAEELAVKPAITEIRPEEQPVQQLSSTTVKDTKRAGYGSGMGDPTRDDLLTYIYKAGGINLGQLTGERRHFMEGIKRPGIFRKKGGLHWDDLETELHENGFLHEGDSLMDALGTAARGEEVYGLGYSLPDKLQREWEEQLGEYQELDTRRKKDEDIASSNLFDNSEWTAVWDRVHAKNATKQDIAEFTKVGKSLGISANGLREIVEDARLEHQESYNPFEPSDTSPPIETRPDKRAKERTGTPEGPSSEGVAVVPPSEQPQAGSAYSPEAGGGRVGPVPAQEIVAGNMVTHPEFGEGRPFRVVETTPERIMVRGGAGKGRIYSIMRDSSIGKGLKKVATDPESAQPAETAPPVETGARDVVSEPSLPSSLAGAKPRYNYGETSYLPDFESDVDKALFIVSQPNRSKADGSYMDFLRGHFPGISDDSLRSAGKQVRNVIKETVKGKPEGAVRIPKTAYNPEAGVLRVGPPPAPGTYEPARDYIERQHTRESVEATRQGTLASRMSDALNRFRYKNTNRFVYTDEVDRLAKRAGLNINPEDSLFVNIRNAQGGAPGEVDASKQILERVTKEARSEGMSDALTEYLDNTGYIGAEQIVREKLANNLRTVQKLEARIEELGRDLQDNDNDPKVRQAARAGLKDAREARAEAIDEAKKFQDKLDNRTVNPQNITADTARNRIGEIKAQLGDQAFARLEELAQPVFDLTRRTWELAHDGGLISDDIYQTGLARGNHIPLHRLIDLLGTREAESESARQAPETGSMMVRQQKVLHGLEGSELTNVHPLEAAHEGLRTAAIQFWQNKVAGTLLNYVKTAPPDWIFSKTIFPVSDKAAAKLPPDFGIFYHWENGARTTYAAPKVLAESLRIMSARDATVLDQALRMVGRVFTRATTGANIEFGIPNVAGDIQDSRDVSRFYKPWNPKDAARHMKEFGEAVIHVVRQSPEYIEWLRSGGAHGTFMKASGGADLNFSAAPPSAGTRLGRAINPFRQVGKFINIGEEASKLSGDLRIRRTRPDVGPNLRAYEVRTNIGTPDAAAGGVDPFFNSLWMFFNVNKEGIFRNVRAARQNPGRTIANLAAYAGAALGLAQWNNSFTDSDGRKSIDRATDNDINNYWVIVTPSHYTDRDGIERNQIVKIKKGHYVKMFVNPIQSAVDELTGVRSQSKAQVALDTISNLIPGNINLKKGQIVDSAVGSVASSLNPLIGAPIEVLRNKAGQRRIVPGRFEGVDEAQQFDYQTSPTIKAASRLPGVRNVPGARSPKLLEHLVRRFGGPVGQQIINIPDTIADLMKPEGEKPPVYGPADVLKKVPIAGRVLQRFVGSPSDQIKRDQAERFYSYLNDARTARNTASLIMRRADAPETEGDIAAASDPRALGQALMATSFESGAAALRKLADTRDGIARNSDLTGQEKRRAIAELGRRETILLDLGGQAIDLQQQYTTQLAEAKDDPARQAALRQLLALQRQLGQIYRGIDKSVSGVERTGLSRLFTSQLSGNASLDAIRRFNEEKRKAVARQLSQPAAGR